MDILPQQQKAGTQKKSCQKGSIEIESAEIPQQVVREHQDGLWLKILDPNNNTVVNWAKLKLI